MNSETINVSLKKESKPFSYPIFVGNNLLKKVDELLKNYIQDKKVIIIYDNVFSSKPLLIDTFKEFVNLVTKNTLSVNLISISGGDQTKNIFELTDIIEQAL